MSSAQMKRYLNSVGLVEEDLPALTEALYLEGFSLDEFVDVMKYSQRHAALAKTMVEVARRARRLEQDLIDELDDLEFQARSPAGEAINSFLALFGPPVKQQQTEAVIREKTASLMRIQGGILDRYGLRKLSRGELQHMLEESEATLKVSAEFLCSDGSTVQELPDLPIVMPVFNSKEVYRLMSRLPEIRKRLVMLKAPEKSPPSAAAQALQMISSANAKLQIIAMVQQEMEDKIQSSPASMRRSIELTYGPILDKLKEP